MGAERDRVAEFGKLENGLRQAGDWYRWGPYVSERQWGTVREDYSADGDAWNYLPHDQARSRAYRWGEDGLAGFCDIEQRLCLALALWNGRDPILKERAFGLTGPQGNHGEDVKEYWWYLDAIPSHAWNRWRYHYPQGAFPYQELIDVNASRDRTQPEYELLDTGVFGDGRYWITEVCYAKASPDDLLMTISVTNAGPDAATLHVLPTAWFRNTWSWGGRRRGAAGARGRGRRGGDGFPPVLRRAGADRRSRTGRDAADHAVLRERDEPGAAVRRGAGHAVPEGRHQRPRDQRGGHRQPRTHRDQVRLLVPGHAGRGRLGRAAAAAAARFGARPGAPGGSGGSGLGVRPGGGGTARRGRRVLRRADAPGRERRRGDGHAAGLRRAAVEQAAVLLRRGPLAGRRPGPAGTAAGAADRAELALAQLRRLRHHVDAGQVGVPLVRRVGPGLPLRGAGARGPGVRQVPADPAVPGVVPAPERDAARVRVELLRRQPAGAGVGRAGGVRGRRGPGPRVPLPGVRQAAGELHLVGQPGRRRRPERVRGRVPRPGQHRAAGPVAPPGRRGSGAVRRHRVDGLFRDRDGPHRHRAGPDRAAPGLRSGAQVPGALRRHPRRAGQPGAVGRRRRVLLRPAGDAVRGAGADQGPVDGGHNPAAGRGGGQRGRPPAGSGSGQAVRGPARPRGPGGRRTRCASAACCARWAASSGSCCRWPTRTG